MLETLETKHDFGLKNIGVIVLVAAVLGVLALNQRPLHLAAVQNKEIEKQKVALKASQSAQVLGASTVDPKILEQFNSIEISTTNDNSKQAFVNYSEQLTIIQQNDLLSEILAATEISPTLISRQNKFVDDLKRLAAPSALADFHRLSIGYYSVLFLNQQGQDNLAVAGILADQLDKLRTGFSTSAGVTLP